MKTNKLFICVFTMLFCNTCLLAQFESKVIHYYDYVSNFTSDVAEAVTIDDSQNTFVAGERLKETSSQDVVVIKYGLAGDSVIKAYVNAAYREYVKKILVANSSIYVICNAVKISDGTATLLVLKYNTSLQLLVANFYLNNNFYAPEDATLDVTGNLLVLCSSKSADNSNTSVVKLNTSLGILSSATYSYQNATDAYNEIPKSIFYNSSENSFYVCGSILNSIDQKSCTFLLKYNNTATPRLAWKKTVVFRNGKNVYNSVMANASRVYVIGGATYTNGKNQMRLNNYTLNGEEEKTLNYGGANINYNKNEGLKITAVFSTGALFVGYSKDSINNKYDIIVGNYQTDINSFTLLKHEELPYNSSINAALSGDGGTYVTGRKAVASAQHMFLYQFNTQNGTGDIIYRDEIVNKSAAGNAIASRFYVNPGSTKFLLRVVGYQDKTSSLFVRSEYKMFSSHYQRAEVGFAKSTATLNNSSIELVKNNTPAFTYQNAPNPFTKSTVIRYDIPNSFKKAQLIITNSAGNTIKTFNLSAKGAGNVTINANELTSGSYYYTLLVDGKKADSKQMVLLR